MSQPAGNKKTIQSVERAAAILRCFIGNEELGLTEISQMIGLHKSTTAGIVNTLKSEGLLEQNEKNSQFRLGLLVFRLNACMKIPLIEMMEPYLGDLLKYTEETVNLVLRDGDSFVYVDKRESPHSMRICTRIGQRVPLSRTAVGRAVLAFLPKEEQDAILESAKLIKLTPSSVTDKEELKRQLHKIREQGYAIDREEIKSGLVSVAAPILDARGRVLGGVCVSGPAMRMTDEKIAGVKDAVLNVVHQVFENETL